MCWAWCSVLLGGVLVLHVPHVLLPGQRGRARVGVPVEERWLHDVAVRGDSRGLVAVLFKRVCGLEPKCYFYNTISPALLCGCGVLTYGCHVCVHVCVCPTTNPEVCSYRMYLLDCFLCSCDTC